MELIFLGGANEVGRESFLLDTGTERFLLDYGVNVQTMASPIEPQLPLTAIILSHAHLDHSGHLPCLYKRGFTGPLIATSPTLDLVELLLTDSIKVQKKKGLTPHYLIEHIEQMLNFSKPTNFDQTINFRTVNVQLRSAGHIPGAASVLIEFGKKRLLYTGDINFIDTVLVGKAYTDYKDVDVLISESTYSYKNHPDRTKLADRLRELVQTTVHNQGFVLLPCFAVGRTQEMLMLVHNLDLPVYLDGMGIEATARTLNWPTFTKDVARLREAFGAARKIRSAKQRKEVLQKPGIIIASAGMLQGGSIQSYVKWLHNRENCLMVLNGYQIEGTPGRTLLDTGRLVLGELDVIPKMTVEFMDFSAHCGRDDLMAFYKKINPAKIVLVHGDRTEAFAQELREEGFDALAPKNGEKIRI